MPRYFFNVQDGETYLDDEGSVLPDIDAARNEAVRASGDLLKFGPSSANLWDGEVWRIWVTDESQKRLFSLTFSALNE